MTTEQTTTAVPHPETDLRAFAEASNLADLIRRSIERFGERNFLGVKKNGVYEWTTYSQFDIQMRKLRTIFKKAGLVKGDRVAIIANNSIEFALTVYAAYGLGGIIVPMYEVQKIQDWEFIFEDAKPKFAVVSTHAIYEKVEGLNCDSLEKIFIIKTEDAKDPNRLSNMIEAETELTEIDDSVQRNDLCDIIYTSGTTGRPRGVELTHHSIMTDGRITAMNFSLSENDRTLSFLPWAHAFGKTVELHVFPGIGSSIGLAESSRTIAQNMLEVNPTILIAVPKIFNKIYDQAHLKAENKAITRKLFHRCETLARKSLTGKLSAVERLEHSVLDKLVASKVRAVFGNAIRFSISGGASLSEEVASFFRGFGVEVYEGYGMTEHSPVLAVNFPGNFKVGAVGRPLPETKLEIVRDNELLDQGDDKCGEIVVSSDCVMVGYHNDPAATSEAIDEQGRLHTGDMGYLDDDGFLWITGRVKEQYKLENGKYVVPSALEEKLNNSVLINLTVVYGCGKPYNVVLINPTPEVVEKFRKDNKLETASNDELAENPKLREMFSKELKTLCEDFRGYEKPQKFAIVIDEFTIHNGLLTPALKIKRREIEKRFSATLAALYK